MFPKQHLEKTRSSFSSRKSKLVKFFINFKHSIENPLFAVNYIQIISMIFYYIPLFASVILT